MNLKSFKICILAIITLIVCGCSSDDDFSLLFNPPDWIIGKWVKSGNSNALNAITLTDNDIISERIDGSIVSLSEFIATSDQEITVSEESTNMSYIVIYTYTHDNNNIVNTFIKITSKELLYNNESYIKE